jgi:nucleoside-diphosphate-sugar epimerase
MAKHFITGVAGFVASNLARTLLKNGHQVVGIDNFSCGFRKNMEDFIEHPKFTFYEQDIRDIAPSEVSYDAVWHLAARGELYYCRDHIGEAIDVNIKGTLKMLDFAKAANAQHFYFADTSAEYDNIKGEENYPTAEKDAPNISTPLGYYAITKMAASQFIRSYGESNGIGTTLFRYTNIYGPSMNLKRDIPPVVGSFTNKMFDGETPIVYGTGRKRRDFLHIDDLNDFHYAAFENRQDKTDSQTYNAGCGKNYEILEIRRLVYNACMKRDSGTPTGILYKPDQPNEAEITQADISKAKNDWGWSPKLSIEEGIDRTVESLWQLRRESNDD